MPSLFKNATVAVGAAFCVAGWTQPAPDINRPASVIPTESEPAPKLVVYPALPAPLARGVVIVEHRTENVRLIPVFRAGAASVSPRVGHLHVTVDERPGTWAHTSVDPIIVMGLKPGAHKLQVELADPNHMILASETVAVTVPEQPGSAAPHKH